MEHRWIDRLGTVAVGIAHQRTFNTVIAETPAFSILVPLGFALLGGYVSSSIDFEL